MGEKEFKECIVVNGEEYMVTYKAEDRRDWGGFLIPDSMIEYDDSGNIIGLKPHNIVEIKPDNRLSARFRRWLSHQLSKLAFFIDDLSERI